MAIYKSCHGQSSHSLVTVKKLVWEGDTAILRA